MPTGSSSCGIRAIVTQIWQWLSVACVLFVITSVISLQGGSEFFGRLFGDKGGGLANKGADIGDSKVAIGYFGAIIGGACPPAW